MLQSDPCLAQPVERKSSGSDVFLLRFEDHLADLLLDLDVSIVELAKHVVLSKGKRIRPLLCFYCGSDKADISPDLLDASAILELVHVATLVHDDIIDQSDVRRGVTTLHSFAGEHTSILLGDALFSFALELASNFPTNRVCQIVAKATRLTCSGEISQTTSRGNFSVSKGHYYKCIQDKTGELFKASCQLGALLGDHSEEDIGLVGDFGIQLGICYQLYDDIMDAFSSITSVHKSTGNDVDSGKLTLQFLILLENASSSEQAYLLDVFHDNTVLSNRGRIIKLLNKYSILKMCTNEFHARFSKTNFLIERISAETLALNLSLFMSLFTSKIPNLDKLETSNFLAK